MGAGHDDKSNYFLFYEGFASIPIPLTTNDRNRRIQL